MQPKTQVAQAVRLDDRRLFDRFTARFPVKFKDSRRDYGNDVFLRDVSANGARITTQEHLYANDNIEMLVELPDGNEPLTLKGKVVWVQGINPSIRNAGVSFEKIDLMQTQRIFRFCL